MVLFQLLLPKKMRGARSGSEEIQKSVSAGKGRKEFGCDISYLRLISAHLAAIEKLAKPRLPSFLRKIHPWFRKRFERSFQKALESEGEAREARRRH